MMLQHWLLHDLSAKCYDVHLALDFVHRIGEVINPLVEFTVVLYDSRIL